VGGADSLRLHRRRSIGYIVLVRLCNMFINRHCEFSLTYSVLKLLLLVIVLKFNARKAWATRK